MADLFYLITFGVPAAVAVVAVIIIFYALGQKKKGNLDADRTYEGIVQTLGKSGKSAKRN